MHLILNIGGLIYYELNLSIELTS